MENNTGKAPLAIAATMTTMHPNLLLLGAALFDFRFIGRAMAILLACACFVQPGAAQDAAVTEGAVRQGAPRDTTAFEGFVASGDYTKANFYLANGFVTAADLDTSQLFYTVLRQNYMNDLARSTRAIDQLYNYLAALAPIDLNRRFACGSGECLLVNHLLRGARPEQIAWFVARGLDLNKRDPDFIPATVPAMVRFGTAYSLTDINWLSANGMILGDETYSLDELVTYEDNYLRPHPAYNLVLPASYLNMGDQNFLDLLVIMLATPVSSSERDESRRHDTLCKFITYAAASYTPSFDYLEHVLNSVPKFRGGRIGEQVRDNAGVYMPFPTSCVTLIQAMAHSHARLNEVMDRFANAGDVETAGWLLTIMQAKN